MQLEIKRKSNPEVKNAETFFDRVVLKSDSAVNEVLDLWQLSETNETQREKNRNYDALHKLIRIGAFDIENAKHREWWTKLSEWAYSGIYRVAVSITSKKIEFWNTKKNEKIEKLEKFWIKNQMDKLLKRAIILDRAHGGVLYCRNANARKYPWRLSEKIARIFSRCEIQRIWGDDQAYPTLFEGYYTAEDILISRVDFKTDENDSFWWASQETPDYLGIPMLWRIFDDLVDYILIKESMKAFALRWGHGFLAVQAKNLDETQRLDLEDALQKLREERGIVLSGAEQGDKIEWFNPSTSFNFEGLLNKVEENLAQGIEMPLRWLKGSEQGALSSSTTDQNQGEVALRQIFNAYHEFIFSVLIFEDQITPEEMAHIEIRIKDDDKTELQTLEQEGLEIDNLLKQTWLTDNEKRDRLGLEPIEGGDQLNSIQMFGQDSDEESDEESNEKPTEEKDEEMQKTDAIGNFIAKKSVREIAKELGISAGTAQKIKSNYLQYEEIEGNSHLDVRINLSDLKTDSNVMIAEGYILTNDSLEYDGVKEARPIETLRNWFEDPRTPKEFFLGANTDDSHTSQVNGEILKDESVGKVIVKGIDNRGLIGEITIDRDRARERLGSEYWIDDYIKQNKSLPLSASSRVKRAIKDRVIFDRDMDIRSFVLTRKPRNENTSVKPKL